MNFDHHAQLDCDTQPASAAARVACSHRAGDWSFRPVYSSYIDLLGVSHGRMPCRRV